MEMPVKLFLWSDVAWVSTSQDSFVSLSANRPFKHKSLNYRKLGKTVMSELCCSTETMKVYSILMRRKFINVFIIFIYLFIYFLLAKNSCKLTLPAWHQTTHRPAQSWQLADRPELVVSAKTELKRSCKCLIYKLNLLLSVCSMCKYAKVLPATSRHHVDLMSTLSATVVAEKSVGAGLSLIVQPQEGNSCIYASQ